MKRFSTKLRTYFTGLAKVVITFNGCWVLYLLIASVSPHPLAILCIGAGIAVIVFVVIIIYCAYQACKEEPYHED